MTILSINKTTEDGRKAPFFVADMKQPLKLRLKNEFTEFRLLLAAVPTIVTVIFIISVVAMNLLANKSVNLPIGWLALDCGIIVSWFAFLTMDTVTKHFGPKAANELTVLAITVNLALCLLFFIASVIPGTWGESYVTGSEDIINGALNSTFGGTWYVLLGSTVAFAASAVINNFINFGIGKAIKNKDGLPAYILRAYVSTAVAQFADNMIFALIVSHFFFGWSILQCVTCAVTGMLVELILEAAFTPLGYRISNGWKKNNVGEKYFEFRRRGEEIYEPQTTEEQI